MREAKKFQKVAPHFPREVGYFTQNQQYRDLGYPMKVVNAGDDFEEIKKTTCA